MNLFSQDIKTLGFIRAVKFFFQRALRGYDDSFMWGMDGYLEIFIPAIKRFCEEEMKDKEFTELNPDKEDIFKTMFEKIKSFEQRPDDDWYKQPNTSSEMWKYFGKYINYFWS